VRWRAPAASIKASAISLVADASSSSAAAAADSKQQQQPSPFDPGEEPGLRSEADEASLRWESGLLKEVGGGSGELVYSSSTAAAAAAATGGSSAALGAVAAKVLPLVADDPCKSRMQGQLLLSDQHEIQWGTVREGGPRCRDPTTP